jgi:NAD+ kinase
MMSVSKIGIIVKHQNEDAAVLSLEIAEFLEGRGYQTLFCDESRAILKKSPSKKKFKVVPKSTLASKVDLIIVFGGDGTYLSAARLMKEKSIPVLGINMGTLGFLTEVKKEEVFDALNTILKGKKIDCSERVMLEAKLIRKGKVLTQDLVVNDVVVSKGAIARIIGIKINIDEHWANTVRADGMIVSTPTGSTAYSLAAGGPIIMPNLACMSITPICPHGLTQRPLIVPDSVKVQMMVEHMPGHVFITLDGQNTIDLQLGDVIEITRFKKHKLKVVKAPNRDYFSLLREKLNFGGK